MVFAVVEKAGTIVMNDQEELDSWSVIINGEVRIDIPTQNGESSSIRFLKCGDSFGITPTMETMLHSGIMRTTHDDCQFVCITQVLSILRKWQRFLGTSHPHLVSLSKFCQFMVANRQLILAYRLITTKFLTMVNQIRNVTKKTESWF